MWKTLRVLDFYSLPLGVPSLGECPKDKGGAASGEVPPLGECPKDKGGAASGEEKVSTNGRRMRGQPFL